MKDKYDCIIVGGGIGGTVMASMLALYDVDVLLIEKNMWLGGCITDYEVKDYTFSHTIDWISGLHEKGKIYYWLDRIGLLDALSFKKLEAFKRVISPDYNICLYTDFDKFRQELVRSFPSEEEGISKLLEFIQSFGTPKWINYFRPYREKMFRAILDDFFKGEEIKTVLSANLNDDMSAFLYILFLFRCLSKQIYLPSDKKFYEIFGMFEERIKELGGEIVKGVAVERIITENGKVTGVELADKRVVYADGIVTDIDLKHVYNDLIGPGNVNDYFMNKINSRGTSASLITTFLGLNREYDGLSKYGEPIVYTPTYVSEDKYAADPDKWHVKINIRSVAQPYLACKGKSVVDIRTFLPDSMMSDNYDKDKYRLEEQYQREKENAEKCLMKAGKKILGEYEPYIEAQRTATPYTFQRYIGGYKGSAMGWAIEPIEYSNGFRIVSPINNLFHVGCWASFPGVEGVVNYSLSILPRIVKFYGKV